MKKFFTVILALLYITTSTGAAFHMHYCMGELAGWGLGHNESKSCGKCGMESSVKKDNGCCKDENKFVKNDADQKTAESAFQMFQAIAIAMPVSFYEIPSADVPSVTEENPQTHSPPESKGVAVYIRNCVFLI